MNDQELISHLRASKQTPVSTDAAKKIQSALLAEFDRVTESQARRSTRANGWFHFLAPRPMFTAAIASIILALGLGTTTIANAAKPGDALFGWDQATERFRLALTPGAAAKATYEAKIAEERIGEKNELEKEKSEHAADAVELSDQALDRALSAVSRVKVELETKKSSTGMAALTKVEARLRTLRGDRDSRIKLEIKTEGAQSKVKIEVGRSKWEWTTSATTSDALLVEIVGKTGLPIDDIRALLNASTTTDDGGGEDEVDDDSRNRNSSSNSNRSTNGSTTGNRNTSNNSNRNRNTNSTLNTNQSDDNGGDDVDDDSTNHNTNTSDDDNDDTNGNTNSDDATSTGTSVIRVRVHSGDGSTEIKTVTNGRETEWEISSIATADIIASITAKTGLSNAAITSMWDFSQE